MRIEIRRVTSADASLFDRIAADVFDEPVRPDRLAAYLAEPQHHMVVAIADGTIVAQCAAVSYRHPDKVAELFIDEIGVSPEWQRQGIGTRLLAEICAIGRSIGCAEAWVLRSTGNQPARALYESFTTRDSEPVAMHSIDL